MADVTGFAVGGEAGEKISQKFGELDTRIDRLDVISNTQDVRQKEMYSIVILGFIAITVTTIGVVIGLVTLLIDYVDYRAEQRVGCCFENYRMQ